MKENEYPKEGNSGEEEEMKKMKLKHLKSQQLYDYCWVVKRKCTQLLIQTPTLIQNNNKQKQIP